MSRWYVTSSKIFVLPTSVTQNSRIVSHYYVKSTKMCTFAHQCDTKCHKSCHTNLPPRPTAASLPHKVHNVSRWYVTSSKIFVLPTSVTRNSRIMSHYYVKSTKMCTFAHQCDMKCHKSCHTNLPPRPTAASLPHKVHNVSRWYVASSSMCLFSDSRDTKQPNNVTLLCQINKNVHFCVLV